MGDHVTPRADRRARGVPARPPTGIVLSGATGDSRHDAGGTLVSGVLMAVVAVVLAAEMRSLLIGESTAPVDHSAAPVNEAAVRIDRLEASIRDAVPFVRRAYLEPDADAPPA